MPKKKNLARSFQDMLENLRVERPDLFEGDPTPLPPLSDAELEEIAKCTEAGPLDMETVRKLGSF